MQGTARQTSHFVRLLISLFSVLLVLSCTTKKLSMKQDRDILEDSDDGYLLLAVDTNKSLESIRIFGKEDISLTKADLQAGSNYILLPLAEGNYFIDKVVANELVSYRFDKKRWSFSISGGVISYVGDFSFQSRGRLATKVLVVLENNSTKALIYMQENFKNLLASRSMRYRGPGEDDFLQFVSESMPKDKSELVPVETLPTQNEKSEK